MKILKILPIFFVIFCCFKDISAFDINKLGKAEDELKYYEDKNKEESLNAIKAITKSKQKFNKIKNLYLGTKVNKTEQFFVVANVNKDVVTNVDIMNAARFIFFSSGKVFSNADVKLMAQSILVKMIDGKLQEQIAAKNKMNISEVQLNDRVRDIAERNGITIEELERKFEQLGIDINIFKRNIASRMLFSAIVEAMKNDIKITEKEIEAAKEQEVKNNKYTRYHIYEIHFNIPNKKEKYKIRKNAESVYKLLKEGFYFTVMAETISQGNYRLRTGDLGWVSEKNLDRSIKNIVVKLKPGEFSNIIDTNTGLKIVYLEDKAEPGKKGSMEAKYKYIKASIQYQGGIMTSSDSEKISKVVEEIKQVKDVYKLKEIYKKNNISFEEKEEIIENPFILNIVSNSIGGPNTAQSMLGENYVDVYFTISKEIPEAEIQSNEEIEKMLISKRVAKDFVRNFKKAAHMSFIKIDNKNLEKLIEGRL